MENFGDFLKAHREKKGIRLEELASITKVTLSSLKHLEANRWDKLPPDPFLRGFVTAYARYVGIPQTEVMERYRKAIQGNVASEPEMVPPSVRVAETPPTEAGRTANQVISESTGLPFGKILWGAAAALVLIVTVSLIYLGKSQSGEELPLAQNSSIPPESESTAGSTNTTTNASPSTVASAPSSPTPAPMTAPTNSHTSLISGSPRVTAAVLPEPLHKLLIRGEGKRTYVKVVVDDAAPIEYFTASQKTTGYAAQKKIKVVVGDVSQVAVLYNDAKADPARLRGGVATYVYPPGSKFPQDVPPATQESEEQDE